MCDLLWADPMEDFTGDDQFEFNTVRGCSWNFGFGAVCKFLEQNKLLSIIRAHEAQDAGYRMHRRNDKTGFPSVITLFSAPNYLDSYNNKGAVLRYENNVINIRQFNHSPHPYYLPGFMNVFAWSLPFVAEKVAEILMTVLKLVDDSEADPDEKRLVLRSKIKGISRMLLILQKMRKERVELVRAGHLSPNGVSLPASFQEGTSQAATSELKPRVSVPLIPLFDHVKEMDRPNEARPSSPRAETPLRSSQDGIQRKLSRDNILFAKRSSGERINFAEILKTASPRTPQIKEDKIET
jgi:serine/threonine-protein phosphatase 2B catalytic subunit